MFRFRRLRPAGGLIVKVPRSWSAGAIAGLLLAASLTVHPQQTRDVPRIGILMFTPMTKDAQEEFRQGFRDNGYVEGQNVVVEWRSAEGNPDRVSPLAVELVRLKVDVIVAEFTPAVRAAKNATQIGRAHV